MRPVLVALPFLILTSWVYYQRIGAFGCFDDCFNIAAGYFISEGKTLYSEIFFNHQPLMPYLSFLIQKVFNPETIYQLILYHRVFILTFSFLMDVLIILRFGLVGLGFAVLYELTKFYIFGDRFLPEALVVYPMVFLFGLVWLKLKGEVISKWESIISAVFTWFVVFMREPLVPLALILYASLLWTKSFSKKHQLSLIFFCGLSLATIILLPIKDYVFNVFQVNAAVEVSIARVYNNLPRIFAYPLYIYFEGQWNFLRPILVGLSTVFLISAAIYGVRLKKLKQVLFIIFILGLANLRVVPPATMFYEAFHMTVWYGLFIIITLLILQELDRKIRIAGIIVFLVIFFYSISRGSFLYEKIDSRHEFTTNYGHYFAQGEVIKRLSNPSDSLFVDGFDELIHWTADRPSSYKYSLYTSVMPYFSVYTKAREEMFKNTPPDFYYGTCPGDVNAQRLMPEEVVSAYTQLYFSEKPTCLYVHKTKLSKITQEQWKKARELGFYSK